MKILIIGNSGSGKTTFAKKLSSDLDLPCFEVDSFVWKPIGYNEKRSEKEIDDSINEILKRDSWIVEGVFGKIAEYFINDANKLIFLNPDIETCLARLSVRGPTYDKYETRAEAESGFAELVSWAGEYKTRETKSSYMFHKKMFDVFEGDKEMVE